MYDYIKGELSGRVSSAKGNFVTLETAGIGYILEVTGRDYNQLDDGNENLKIYTVLIHKEDKMMLCGFLRREDRDIFNVLTSVSGVGVKMAFTLLDEFESSELIGLVIEGNYKALTTAKGVGPKLAQKIILELKDKLMNMKTKTPIKITAVKVKNTQSVTDAQMVMESFGYEQDEIKNAISKVLMENSDYSAEDILKNALKLLS